MRKNVLKSRLKRPKKLKICVLGVKRLIFTRHCAIIFVMDS